MIQIKKGTQVLTVSQGAYNDMFKKLGYEIVNSKEEAKKASSDEKQKSNSKEDKLIKEEQEKNEETKENEDIVKSDELSVNIIGENIENNKNFDDDKVDGAKSILDKVIEQKSKSKRK